MHMKYFQGIADIQNHYDDILDRIDNPLPSVGNVLLEHWGVDPKDKEVFMEEREVLRYLVGCQLSLTHDTNVTKPALATVTRCFERHLTYLEKIHKIHAYNVNSHPSKFKKREYKACRHYLFKFSLPAWYEKLPDEILTYENKYKNMDL